MAQKEAGVEQSRVKTGDSLGSKAVVGAPTAGGGVVVEVREKKGPLRAAIPTMPFPLAVICLFLNTFIPGLVLCWQVSQSATLESLLIHSTLADGTFISAFTVLCGARSDLVSERGKCCVFWLNVAAALIQIVTAVIMVGWIMSIFWGMDMVILAISDGCRDQGVPQDVWDDAGTLGHLLTFRFVVTRGCLPFNHSGESIGLYKTREKEDGVVRCAVYWAKIY